MDINVLETSLLFLFISFSFLMSGMEAGVFALSPLRIRQLRRKGDRRAEILYGHLEKPEHFLWTILVGNTISNFAIFVLIALSINHAAHGEIWFSALIYALTILIFYSVCELLPKVLFRQFPNRLCLAMAHPFRWIALLLSPLVQLVSWFSRGLLRLTGGKAFIGNIFGNREEVRFIMEDSASALSSDERVLIQRVLEIQNLTVRSITIPWDKVVSVKAGTSMTEVMQIFQGSKIQRIPVWKNEDRRIAGILNLKHVLYQTDEVNKKVAGDFLQPAIFLDERIRLDDALRRMQRSGRRLAVVIGPDKRETGIVSLHDMLKVIFGDFNL